MIFIVAFILSHQSCYKIEDVASMDFNSLFIFLNDPEIQEQTSIKAASYCYGLLSEVSWPYGKIFAGINHFPV